MTRGMKEITNSEDLIDSRDVLNRIASLEDDVEGGIITEDETADLAALKALADDAEGYAGDWKYGATLIRDSYFEEYTQELAEDIGAIGRDAPWPACHIDWEAAANALKQDYTEVDFDGVTYWVR